MKTYADTSILFSLYVTDAHSPKADAWRQANPDPLDFTGLHRIELRNAFSLAVFQQRLTPEEAQAAWQEVREDLASGVLVSRPNLWSRLLREAESLAEHHTPAIGSRSLDILHVAAALALGATEFCTFDTRQGRLAQLAGLHVRSVDNDLTAAPEALNGRSDELGWDPVLGTAGRTGNNPERSLRIKLTIWNSAGAERHICAGDQTQVLPRGIGYTHKPPRLARKHIFKGVPSKPTVAEPLVAGRIRVRK